MYSINHPHISRLPLLVLMIWVAVVTAGRVITLTYDPAFDAAMPNLNFGPNTATAQLDLIRSNRSNIDDIDFHLSPFIIPAPILTSGNYTNKPVAIVSMCLASSVGNSTGLSLKQIGAAMSGTPSAATASILWYIAPATVSPSSASLLQALVLNGIAPFTSTTAWPAAVLTNPNVQLVPDGASVSAALNNCPPSVWCIGPQLNFAAWASAKQCLRIRRTVTVTGDTISYSNRLTEATAPFTIVEPQNSTAYSQGPVYPFIGGVYLSTRLGVPCDVMDALTDMLVTFFTNATNHAALDALGMQSLGITDSYATLNLLQPMSETNCSSNVFTASVKGDSNLYDAFANLNFDAFTNKNFEYMVSLNSGTTAAVLADLYDPETMSHAAFVEGAPNVTLRATKPSIVTGPLFAHGLAVVYSLDGRDDLVASPCTMLGIMNGTIQYWDDPALTADNLGIQLPHLKITRVMPAEGSQEAAGRGVSYIARRCGVNLVTSYTRFPFKSDVQGLASSQVVPQVQIIPGAIGLAPTSSAFDASMQRLAIRFPSKLQLSGSMDDITSTIAQSTINLTTNAVKFPARTVDYFPFVAIVYAVVDTDAQGGCDAYTRTLQWLIYVAGQSAETVLTNANHVVLSDTMRALVAAAIAQTKCDGIILFPLPVTPILWWPYAVAAAVVLALIAVIVVRMGNQFWLMRVRPTDPTKPIAVMFVGVKNQAAVMEAGEENAAAVFRCVADMVRRMVCEHGCYEARRIDAATTMIVAKDAKSAAACAEDVVLALSQDVAWLDAVMTYPMPEQSKLPRQRHSSLHPSKTPRSARNRKASTMLTSRTISDPNMHRTTSDINATMTSEVATTPLSQTSSNEQHAHTGSSGLTLQKCVPEIYAGVHWTHVMIEARDTTVSYHGAGITTAACIADLAVGGQIIVSRELMDQLSIETADDDKGMWYGFAAVGDGSSSDHLVGMSLTTPRFPEWLIARSALRRKSLEEKDSHDGNMIAAAMASADGALGKRRIAAVSMLVQDLVNEGAEGRAAVVGETLAELLDIVTSNRGQIHSITDGVVTVTVGAGAPVAMASVRAAQIAMQASDLCAAIGVHSGSAMVGNAMGGKPATVGRVVAGAALMRVVAARAGVRVCATDVAKSELAAKFELATVDLVAVPWDLVKTFRCLCLAEERTQSEEGEWLYDMADGFAVFERRLDGCLSTQISVEDEPDVEQGASKTEPRSALLDRHADICSASNELYRTLLSARNGCFVKELATSRLSSLGSFAFLGGPRATVL